MSADALPPLTYLSPEAVAKLLAVSTKVVYRLVAQDRTFPAVRLGTGKNALIRINPDRLARWLDRGGSAQRRPISAHDGANSAPSKDPRCDGVSHEPVEQAKS